ncbi:MAG: hypothetical protein ACHQ2Z_03040 [Elusimicrobiota bacterium]
MITAVMGVAVTAKQGSGKAMHRMMFDQGIAQLSTEVKEYVTACGCDACTGFCPSPACADPGISGPNTLNAGAAQWYLNGAPGAGATGKLIDSMGDVWALTSGAHQITGMFPTTPAAMNLEAPPYVGKIVYTVAWPAGCPGTGVPGINDAPTIKFMANWSEP